MAWEKRRNGWFYYRSRRVGSLVKKEFFGNGALATLAAYQDEQKQFHKANQRERRQEARAQIRLADELIDRLGETVDTLASPDFMDHGGQP